MRDPGRGGLEVRDFDLWLQSDEDFLPQGKEQMEEGREGGEEGEDAICVFV